MPVHFLNYLVQATGTKHKGYKKCGCGGLSKHDRGRDQPVRGLYSQRILQSNDGAGRTPAGLEEAGHLLLPCLGKH